MFDNLPITQITLMPGRSPGMPNQELDLCSLTVFVGPNNSGKSLALSEIHGFVSHSGNKPRHIIAKCNMRALSVEEAEHVEKLYRYIPTSAEEQLHESIISYKFRGGRSNFNKQSLRNIFLNPTSQPTEFSRLYLSNVTVNLGGESRISLTGMRPLGDIQDPDRFNSFQMLFNRDDLREEVRSILFRAFKKYFVLDPTQVGQVKIAFANRPPKDNREEQGLFKEARDYFASAESIQQVSDGIKAYTGIVIEIVAGNPRIVLIDEPEAFLHPPLAQKLGTEVAKIAKETNKNVFISTHSANFVMGCLHSGAPVDIVRMTYANGIATARVLKNADLIKMMRNPLMRSAGAINALFYDCVVVTESDADRAFYQEINERLLLYTHGRGIPNCLFLNAQNKQTTRMITKPLRELGIPAVSIVDVDVLKEGGTVWMDFLESGFLPELEKKSLATIREGLNTQLATFGKDFKKKGGINLLDRNAKEAANNAFDRLEEYGLFVIRQGEVESWLKPLGVQGHTPQWLIEVFEKLGDNPSSKGYVKPGNDDVWAFMDRIQKWLLDSNKKGIPE